MDTPPAPAPRDDDGWPDPGAPLPPVDPALPEVELPVPVQPPVGAAGGFAGAAQSATAAAQAGLPVELPRTPPPPARAPGLHQPSSANVRPPAPPEPPFWRIFFGLPALSAICVVLSAASIMGGAAAVLGPALGDSSRSGEIFALIGVLHGYELALLAVAAAMCRWSRGNHDAIGVAVLIALMALGTSTTLAPAAAFRPGLVLGLGAAGLVLAVGKHLILGARVWGRADRLWTCGLGILLGCAALAPGLLGLWHAHMSPLHDIRQPWLAGVLVELVGAALLLAGAARTFRPAADRAEPFLRRSGMRWVAALLVLAGCGAQQWVLGLVFDIAMPLRAVVPALVALALLGEELCWRAWGRNERRTALLAGGPALGCAAWGLFAGAPLATPLDVALDPACLGLLASLALLLRAAARDDTLARAVALGGGLLALLGVARDPGAAYNLATAAFALAAGLGWRAWRTRSAPSLAAAIGAAALVVVLQPRIDLWITRGDLMPGAVWLALAGSGVLVQAVARPGALASRVARMASLALVIGVLHACFRAGAPLHAPAPAAALLACAAAAAAWRLRDPFVAAPALLPLGLAAWPLVRRSPAWVAVGAAFPLLLAAAWSSRRRVAAARDRAAA